MLTEDQRLVQAAQDICDATALSLCELGGALMKKYGLDVDQMASAMMIGLLNASIAAFVALHELDNNGDAIYEEILGVFGKYEPKPE